jgi:alkanesulfonate monooxygenase SsuD/methylene tetrahydromethanopterin reductase-like flavin-dependent oxidoreductase (luciferase family)
MKWGVAINVKEKLSETIRKAEVADKGEIDQVWITDFPALRYAPAVAAAVAEKTEACRIGVGLMSPLLYSSTHVIQLMSTLIDHYGSRFDVLLGPGDRRVLASVGVSHSAKGAAQKTVTVLEEIKHGLSESEYDCSVLLGAQGPVMIKASLKADGVLLNYSDIEMLEWALELVKGRAPDNFQLGVFSPTYVGDCQDIMNNTGISLSAAMVAVGLNKKVSELFGLHNKIEAARNRLKIKGQLDIEIARFLGSDILEKFAFCGTEEQLINYLNQLEGIGISSVVFGPPQGIRKKGVDILVNTRSCV